MPDNGIAEVNSSRTFHQSSGDESTARDTEKMADSSTRNTDPHPIELSDAIGWLRDLSDEELANLGISVEGTFDEIDDPILIGPDGLPVDTWKEGYPFDRRMTRTEYERDKRLLQIELLKAQSWVKESGQRLVVVFEGRDAAGKGGTIKRFTEHLNPRGTKVVALSAPSEREKGQRYFQRYIAHLRSNTS